ncbi:MAG TPA: hypothetical protein VF026_20430, partial [Ktedonobacteraceae bacterium]
MPTPPVVRGGGHRSYPPSPLSLAQGAERGPDLGREQLRLLPGGEVTALVDLVVVDGVGVPLLDPTARGPEDLARERGEADRERDLRRSLARRGRASLGLAVLPVRPGRRCPGARQPVQRDVVQDVVAGETARGLPVDKGAG